MPININSEDIIPQPRFQYSDRNLGEPSYVPWDVTRRRRSIENLFRRVGEPVFLKHRYSDLDVRDGVAQKAVDNQGVYEQPRNNAISLGTGFWSVELSDDEWYDNKGNIVTFPLPPGPGYIQAPKYRGFGPGTETYCIFPDVPRNYFSYEPGGAMFNVEEGKALLPWYPKMFDGDLIVKVIRDKGYNIIGVGDVYEAKQVTPVSVRGFDRRGKYPVPNDPNDKLGNRFLLHQLFDAVLLPALDPRVTGLQYNV